MNRLQKDKGFAFQARVDYSNPLTEFSSFKKPFLLPRPLAFTVTRFITSRELSVAVAVRVASFVFGEVLWKMVAGFIVSLDCR